MLSFQGGPLVKRGLWIALYEVTVVAALSARIGLDMSLARQSGLGAWLIDSQLGQCQKSPGLDMMYRDIRAMCCR